MSKPNIQNSKFTPAALPDVCAPRGDMISRLEAAAEKRLVFVCAPAGSGKTVSALLWLKASRRKTVWIGLDAFDNSTAVFYRMFCMAIFSAQPDNDRMADVLRSSGFDSSPVEHTINLLTEFLMDANDYTLVLDDFHTITNPEILRSFPFILRRLPHAFVTLILSRADPTEALADQIAKEQATLLGFAELAFSMQEIQAFFAALGKPVSENDAAAALSFTGGWAIGVNALAHSTGPVPDGRGVRILEQYIKKQMWNEWDESLRTFMLASSALDEMPIPLCKTITGRADTAVLLESLRAENAFIARISEGVYRYHHLFLDFLRAQPEYAALDKRKSWLAAAEYYMERQDHLVAKRYAYQSGDIEMILLTMDGFLDNRGFSIDEYLGISREFLLSPAMDALCEKCHVMYIPRAWTAFLSGDAGTYELYMDRLYQNLVIILAEYPSFGELMLSLSVLDYRVPFALRIARADSLPPVTFQGDALRAASMSLQMPFLHRSSRDYYELSDTALHQALKMTFGKLLKNHYDIIMHCIGAGLSLEHNQVNDSLTDAKSAVSLCGTWTVKEIRFAVTMHLAASYLAQGKDAELAEALAEVERFVDGQAQFLRPNFLAFVARTKLWDGSVDAAREWLDRYFVNESRVLEPYRIYQYFTTVRAYAVLGELDKATHLAMRLRQYGKDFHRPLDAAEAGAILAATLWAVGDSKKAQELLEAILAEMQPYGFIRVIADEGRAVIPILKKILSKVNHADYKGELDRLYINSMYYAAYAVSKQRGGLFARRVPKPIKLSKQQKMILELYAQGYNRNDIINTAGLSLNTVKSHTRLLYDKLGVSNTADAIIKAKSYGLLE